MEIDGGKVNYMLEINAFYRWLENNPLSSSAIALWHALMQQWNLSYWEENFTPAMAILCMRSGLSKNSILKARGELCEAGRLRCHERGGRNFTRYEVIPFEAQNCTLYKLNKTKLNETKLNYSPLDVGRDENGMLVPAGILALSQRRCE